MRQTRTLLGGALVALLALTSGALAKPAYVASTVNLRQSSSTTSEIVGKIPAGSLIEAEDCRDGWCAVTWQGKVGFAIQTAIDTSGRVPQRQVTRQVTRAPVRQPAFGPGGYYEDEPEVFYEPPPPVFVRPYLYGGFGYPYGRRWHRW
jgi:uncharacterized protein YraI